MNIVEIKKMVEEAVPSLENDTELRYLLSVIGEQMEYMEGYSEESIRIESQLRDRLQQAENALESVANAPARETMRRYAEEGLKAIRGN